MTAKPAGASESSHNAGVVLSAPVKKFRILLRRMLPDWLLAPLRLVASSDPRRRAPPILFRKRVETHVYGGFPLRVEIADRLAEEWHGYDWPVMHDIDQLRRGQLRPGARVFNIGAHQAIVGMVMASIVGEQGEVVAIEANAHNAAMAQHNKELNGLSQLTVVHAAAAAESGTVTFNRALLGKVDDGAGGLGRIQVPALSVDDLAQRFGSPSLLYMDVEGYECQVLRGSTQVLRRHPDCFVEVHVGCGLEKFGGSVDQVLSCFPPEHYELFMSCEEHHRSENGHSFVPFDPTDDMVRRRFFLIATSRALP